MNFQTSTFFLTKLLDLHKFHDGILLQWSMNRDKIDGEAYVNTFKKMVLKGLMV